MFAAKKIGLLVLGAAFSTQCSVAQPSASNVRQASGFEQLVDVGGRLEEWS